MRRTSPVLRATIGAALILAGSSATAAPPRDESATTVYRDEYGIPHVYAPTLEDAAYGIGYAQAEDRLEELLKNYRRAAGTMAEAFGPRFYQDDLAQRIWRHAEISRAGYPRLSPKWRGIHPLADLVQITNPPGGWMQNCNCAPSAMMDGSPMVAETYRDAHYLYNGGRAATHQRAQMMNRILAAADRVTVSQAIDIAFHPGVYRAERWQARIIEAWSRAKAAERQGDAAELVRRIEGWDRRCDADSTGALAYYAFKRALGNDLGSKVEPPADLQDGPILEGLRQGAAWLRSSFGTLDIPYGRYFRVGREGSERSWPVGGGTLKDQGMATPRAISFDPTPDGKSMIGHGGQTSTQVIIMTDPPKSYAVIPLGESDHKESGHWDDQAEKLFSKAQAAPTYFLDERGLLEHVTGTKVLRPERPRSVDR